MKYLIYFAILFHASCDCYAMSKLFPQAKVEQKEVVKPNPSPIVIDAPKGDYKADWDHKAEGKLWTQITSAALDELGRDMLLMEAPKDADKYCKGFGSMTYEQRKQCFIGLISSMARFESNFTPSQSYTEDFNDAKGKKVVSRGLLQLSIESGKSYGCELKTAQDLHDPKANLRCAVRILNRWIPKDKYIGTAKLGGARYWSVLRDTSKSQAKVRAKTLALVFK